MATNLKEYIRESVSQYLPHIKTALSGKSNTDHNHSGVYEPADETILKSDTTGVIGADQITNVFSLTQAEYDAIATPDASTLYVILG